MRNLSEVSEGAERCPPGPVRADLPAGGDGARVPGGQENLLHQVGETAPIELPYQVQPTLHHLSASLSFQIICKLILLPDAD